MSGVDRAATFAAGALAGIAAVLTWALLPDWRDNRRWRRRLREWERSEIRFAGGKR